MAKAVALVSALCILAFATVAHSHKNVFDIEGDVYCDPCRVQFQTELSQKLAGATVRVECTELVTKAVTYSVDGVTDENGHYSLRVVGDYQNDYCVVKAVKSPREDCAELMTEVPETRIVCTNNIGMPSDVRHTNPIGFMTREGIPQCVSVLQDFFADD